MVGVSVRMGHKSQDAINSVLYAKHTNDTISRAILLYYQYTILYHKTVQYQLAHIDTLQWGAIPITAPRYWCHIYGSNYHVRHKCFHLGTINS